MIFISRLSLVCSDSEAKRSTDGSNGFMNAGSDGMRRRRGRASRGRGKGRSLMDRLANQNIISRMLSSKETLVVMCLREQQFDQAKQVIQVTGEPKS